MLSTPPICCESMLSEIFICFSLLSLCRFDFGSICPISPKFGHRPRKKSERPLHIFIPLLLRFLIEGQVFLFLFLKSWEKKKDNIYRSMVNQRFILFIRCQPFSGAITINDILLSLKSSCSFYSDVYAIIKKWEKHVTDRQSPLSSFFWSDSTIRGALFTCLYELRRDRD